MTKGDEIFLVISISRRAFSIWSGSEQIMRLMATEVLFVLPSRSFVTLVASRTVLNPPEPSSPSSM